MRGACMLETNRRNLSLFFSLVRPVPTTLARHTVDVQDEQTQVPQAVSPWPRWLSPVLSLPRAEDSVLQVANARGARGSGV